MNRRGVANLAVLLGELTQATPEQAQEGSSGAAALKSTVADALIETLSPMQKLYTELTEDTPMLLPPLQAGPDAVSGDALETVARAREAMGLLPLN